MCHLEERRWWRFPRQWVEKVEVLKRTCILLGYLTDENHKQILSTFKYQKRPSEIRKMWWNLIQNKRSIMLGTDQTYITPNWNQIKMWPSKRLRRFNKNPWGSTSSYCVDGPWYKSMWRLRTWRGNNTCRHTNWPLCSENLVIIQIHKCFSSRKICNLGFFFLCWLMNSLKPIYWQNHFGFWIAYYKSIKM